MNVNIEQSWKGILSDEFESEYFKTLAEFVKNEYSMGQVYPPGKEIFAAFDHCAFKDVQVVIIGQDPYHGPGQANGLCFSVSDGISFPPSLKNIFKEVSSDLGLPTPMSGDLSRWAMQGVLLLNSTLTVRAASAGSHQRKGWEQFTDAVITAINQQKENVVFMLWGGYAKQKGKKIDRNRHFVLESGHPSPLSANKGHWFGNKHFSMCNSFLKEKGLPEINWE